MAAVRSPDASDPPLPGTVASLDSAVAQDPQTPTDRPPRHLRTRPSGLSERKAQRRLGQHGPNVGQVS